MEIFLLLIVLVLLIVIKSESSGNKKRLQQLHNIIALMQKNIDSLRSEKLITPKQKEVDPSLQRPEIIIEKTKPGKIIPKSTEPAAIEKGMNIAEDINMPTKDVPNKKTGAAEIISRAQVQPSNIQAPQHSWFSKWLIKNPDMEKFIGENLINKIGIAVLVLGISFFVKYAIDQEWINEVGRVAIGLVCGGILIVFAHLLRKNYHAFSSVLAGGGLTVFYFTIAFAFHKYQLMSQGVAFVIMVVITVFAILLSIFYNRIELAILATTGGFITPFLVSTGQGNYMVLFTYLCILNAGLIVLAYYKRWRVLNFISFVFTLIIYGGWIVNKAGDTSFPYAGTFIFGSIFYLVFVGMNIIYHVSRSSKLNAFDFIMLLSINLAYYSAGYYVLKLWGMDRYQGLFTAAPGILNLILAYVFFKKQKIDKNFVYLLIGLTLSFMSLAAPVQLNGNHITLFWSAEAVVLFWLYQKSFIRLLKIGSLVVTVLMLISLLMDWVQVYGNTTNVLPAIINRGFITTIVSAVAMFLLFAMHGKEADTFSLNGISNKLVRTGYIIGCVCLFFIAGILEIYHQFNSRFTGAGLQYMYLQLYIISFFVALFALAPRLKITISDYVRLGLPALLFVLYAFNTGNIYSIEKEMLITGKNGLHFLAHWVSLILFLILMWNTIKNTRMNSTRLHKTLNGFSWITTIAIIILLSIEVRHICVWLYYDAPVSIMRVENLYSKAGLSSVWGISSFIIIWLGMHYRFKPLRLAGLVLFGITLIKLFAFDIRNIPPGGKIAAFILLGVLLLIVSFMYQRLKKLIIDDGSKS